MELLDLESLQGDTIECFRGPVVYFLFHKKELVYIGCTLNFLGRIGSHATGRNRKEFDSFKVVRVPDDVAPVHLERAYIRKYRPKLNTVATHEKDIDELGYKAIDRAMMRIKSGESIAEAAAAEKLSTGVVRARYERIRKQDEKDKLLLSIVHARPTQESLRANRDANLGIYSKGGGRRPEEASPVTDNR